MGTQKLIENVKWDENVSAAGAFVYGAQFGKGKLTMLGGVSHGTNEFRLFDRTKAGSYKSSVSICGL